MLADRLIPTPPKHGSPEWKDERARAFAAVHGWFSRHSAVYRLPLIDGVDCGWFVVHRLHGGCYWFRTDKIEE